MVAILNVVANLSASKFSFFDCAIIAASILYVAMAAGAVLARCAVTINVFFGLFSMACVLEYFLLNAPDVAMTEACVGTFVSSVFYLLTRRAIAVDEYPRIVKRDAIVGLVSSCATFWALYLAIFSSGFMVLLRSLTSNIDAKFAPWLHGEVQISRHFLDVTHAQTGIDNIVTAILASYRGYDTLGETTIILIASLGVHAVIRSIPQSDVKPEAGNPRDQTPL